MRKIKMQNLNDLRVNEAFKKTAKMWESLWKTRLFHIILPRAGFPPYPFPFCSF